MIKIRIFLWLLWEVNSLYLAILLSPLSTLSQIHPFPYCTHFVFCFLLLVFWKIHPAWFLLPIYSWQCGHPLEYGVLLGVTLLGKNWLFFLAATNGQYFLSRDGILCQLCTPCWDFACLSLCRPCACCYKHCTFICATGLLCPEKATSLEFSAISASYNLLGSHLGWWLSLGCDECGIDISGRVQHCVLSYSLTIFQLWVSVLIVMDSKKKLICKDWMYWYSTKTLGVGLSLFPYRRIVAASSTLGFNTCLAIHFWSR